ncbi:MAG: HlyD family efflux transporter periplasmic adaptor subunit [Phycisphaera sp.]|nr:HlyD family efflux transporter periplasmic adaptor subunit [Phycisphaera sp.]
MTTTPVRTTPSPYASVPPLVGTVVMMLAFTLGCGRNAGEEAASVRKLDSIPSDRIEIPASVRRHLGIEFTKVESREVESVLRIPGRFELLPDARRERRAPTDGRVEMLVSELETVVPGTPLFRISGGGWLDLEERITKATDRLDSMAPLQEAHGRREKVLTERVTLWKQRLQQLDRLREDGRDEAIALMQARTTIIEAESQLAEVRQEDARLTADRTILRTELESLLARRNRIRRVSGCLDAAGGLLVCAMVEGVIEEIVAPPGTLVTEGDPILTLIQPDRVRIRARMLQSDLPFVTDGLPARITAPSAVSEQALESMPATVTLSPTADPDGRTIDLLARPERLANWARPGLGISLEVILQGGRIELAIPERAIVTAAGVPILFRRDPANPDLAIRIDADLGRSDGRWVEILSGVAEGDEVVVEGQDQLLLASGERPQAAGHFHADGTFHAEDH